MLLDFVTKDLNKFYKQLCEVKLIFNCIITYG